MGRAMMYSKILQCTNMYISVQIHPYGKGCFSKFFKNQNFTISAHGPDPTIQESKQNFLQTPGTTMPWDLPLLNVQKANCKNLHNLNKQRKILLVMNVVDPFNEFYLMVAGIMAIAVSLVVLTCAHIPLTTTELILCGFGVAWGISIAGPSSSHIRDAIFAWYRKDNPTKL